MDLSRGYFKKSWNNVAVVVMCQWNFPRRQTCFAEVQVTLTCRAVLMFFFPRRLFHRYRTRSEASKAAGSFAAVLVFERIESYKRTASESKVLHRFFAGLKKFRGFLFYLLAFPERGGYYLCIHILRVFVQI